MFGIEKKPFNFLGKKKEENTDILTADYQNGLERSCRRPKTCQLFCSLRFTVHMFHLIRLHVFFSQANFTFSFVENLRTYSETWLRMSEVFKTSGNVLTVSRLQVGEPWEIFLFSSFLLFDLDSVSTCAKPPIYLTSDLKRTENEAE